MERTGARHLDEGYRELWLAAELSPMSRVGVTIGRCLNGGLPSGQRSQ